MAAGLVNALAGGGTLITFPTLTAIGLPAVVANVTNTVALCPGYLGATFAQAKDLVGQKKRLWLYLPAGVIGGVIGGILLLHTGEKVFRMLVPILILMASVLLGIQGKLKEALAHRGVKKNASILAEIGGAFLVVLAAVYGGYFGAGLSVIILAVLGLLLDDSLTQINALKQSIAFATNLAAAILFIFSGQVVWSAVVVMAIGALLGGAIGGKLAGRIKPSWLRAVVVIIGVIVAIIYWIKG